MATQMTLYYFIKLGGLDQVIVETTTTIDVILDKIYDDAKFFFRRHSLAKSNLELYAPSDLTRKPINNLPQRVDGWQLGDPLDLGASIAETFSNGLDRELVHLVVVPRPAVVEPAVNSRSEITPFVPPVAQNKYHDYLTFSVRRLSSGKPDWPSVIRLNDYRTYPARFLPQFVKDVVERPRRIATVEPIVEPDLDFFRLTLSKFIPSDDLTQIFQKLLSSANDALPYTDENLEICHFIHAACTYHILPGSQYELTKEILYILVFNKFRLYWEKQVEGGECNFEKQFPSPLISIVEDAKEMDEAKCKYRAQPDVAFYKHQFPCFMAEIDSKDNAKAIHRLYVQLACSLRLGLALRGETSDKNKDLFLMGAYITKYEVIHRLFVYADEKTGKPTFNEQLYNMNDVFDFTTFLFEFYNYARHIRDEDKLSSKTEDIETLAQSISVGYTQSLHTENQNLSDSEEDDSNRDSSNRGSKKDFKKQRQMTAALRESGFVVKNYQYDAELEPLIKLPDHVVEATSSNRVRVIAKLLHKDSDELSLLRELATQKSPHNHDIPLLSTVQSSLGPLIILPYEAPLSTLFLFGDISNRESERLSRELVEGVAFLHRLKIAHLDFKPDNLVFSRKSKRLHIIDFDIAMRCKDVEATVKTSCGTPGWSAPEIVHDDNKPMRAVSPIRADLWSCGKVLEFLAVQTEIDRAVMKLTNLLLNHDPMRRPLLHEVVDEEPDFWASGRLLQALISHGFCDKVQETVLGRGLCKLKRARDDTSHASDDGLPSKVPRKAGDSTTRSSSPLDSLPSSSS